MTYRKSEHDAARLVVAFAAVATLLLLAIVVAKGLPPSSGTIIDKAHHPEWFGGGPAPEAYCLVIRSDRLPETVHTWYVDRDVYDSFDVGDYITALGGHGHGW